MKAARPPAKPVCALCGTDDGVTTLRLGEGVWEHTCRSTDGHPQSRTWQEDHSGVDELGLEGLAQEWGLYDDLPLCLLAGDPFVEYGIVEHRYRSANPSRYAFLLRRYGHTSIAPSPYTTSSFIAGALGRMASAGLVAPGVFGPATGYWAYNTQISYWALPGLEGSVATLTWKAFAEGRGVNADQWVL